MRFVTTAHSDAVLQELPAPDFQIRLANRKLLTSKEQVILRFFIGGRLLKKTFVFQLPGRLFP